MNRNNNFNDSFWNPENRTSHGSADFAGYWERKKLLKRSNKGIYIANDVRLSTDNSTKHLIAIAPSGSGKTTRLILNNALRKWNKNTSLVFFDVSSEIYNNSARWLRKQGFNVVKLDFTRPNESATCNPLLLVHDKSSARIVAQAIMMSVYVSQNEDAFWVQSGIAALTLLILATVQGMPPEQRTLNFVFRLINKFGHSDEEVNVLMESALNDDDYDEYASFIANSEKVRMSMIATIKSALYIYSDETLKHISSQNSFDFTQLRKKRTALFLIQDSHKIPYFKGWWSLFFRQLFEYLMTDSRGKYVYLFADEFASFSIPDIEVIMATIRKKKVSLNLILQSYEQLASVYNPDKARIIFQNAYSKLFLSGLSFESAQMVSDLLGQATETYSSRSDKNRSLHRNMRNLLTPDEVRRLDEEHCLFIAGNHKPMKLKMGAFYNNWKLKRRSKL